MYICTKCYYSGRPVETAKDKPGGISGFISAVFNANSKVDTCQQCHNQNLIALTTDEGKKLLDSVTK